MPVKLKVEVWVFMCASFKPNGPAQAQPPERDSVCADDVRVPQTGQLPGDACVGDECPATNKATVPGNPVRLSDLPMTTGVAGVEPDRVHA